MRISDWSSDVCSADLLKFFMRDCRMSAVANTCDERCGKGFGVGLAAEIASTDPVDVEGLVNRLAQPCGFVVPFQVIEHHRRGAQQIGRASCRERVCQYV